MTIDLKWLLPFVLPFAILATLRALVFVAGSGFNAELALSISAFCGSIGGIFLVICMAHYGIRWNVTIGKGDKK